MLSITRRRLGALLISVCVCGLTACQSGQEAELDDYLRRLENALQVDRPTDVVSIEFPTMPRQRLLQTAEEPQTDISLLQFLGLKKCALSQTVAQRNSALGKIASSSQHLLFELEFLQHAPACVEELISQDKQELADKIQLAAEEKQQKLTHSLWQALVTSEEYRQFWSRSHQQKVQNYPQQLPDGQVEALRGLVNIVQRALSATPDYAKLSQFPLETPLGTIRSGDGGQLLLDYLAIEKTMLSGNAMLETALAKPFCYNQITKPQARIVQNVVNKFFIAKIQRRFAMLERRRQQLMPLILDLEDRLAGAETELFKAWRKQRNNQLANARKAFDAHITAIQQLYQQCGLQPGNRQH